MYVRIVDVSGGSAEASTRAPGVRWTYSQLPLSMSSVSKESAKTRAITAATRTGRNKARGSMMDGGGCGFGEEGVRWMEAR